MGWEPVLYKGKWFDLNNQIVSWLQKFMELYLSKQKHPQWFCEVLSDLHGNFHVPHGKYFFDEDIIGDDKDRLMYCIEMLNLTIGKMQSISKRDFFEFIKEDIKDSWCNIDNDFYNDEWLNDDESYRKNYVESLFKLRSMLEN